MDTDVSVDREADLAILAQLRERIAQPGLGIESLTRLSNEIRQREKALRADASEPKAAVVSVDSAREAFVVAFGYIDPAVFVKVRAEASEGRLLPGGVRATAGLRRSADWWERFGDSPVALLECRRAARRLGIVVGHAHTTTSNELS